MMRVVGLIAMSAQTMEVTTQLLQPSILWGFMEPYVALTYPAYYSFGRLVELNCTLADYAGIDFHSNDAYTSMITYHSRNYSSGGTNAKSAQGVLCYEAKSHNFISNNNSCYHRIWNITVVSAVVW